MRLTLRSLLAYLDDVLKPTEAKEIGEKISSNPEASALVARIKDVIRRRRIGAPELSGSGSGPDPNLVADYIENTLTPPEVVELERLCMESDMHLAEVAACHKILTLVLGQPLDVPDEVRERMYVLGAVQNGNGSPANSSIPVEEQADLPEVSSLADGLPDYLTRKPLFQRFSTILIGLLIGIVWVGLLWSDKSLWTNPKEAVVVEATNQGESPQDGPSSTEVPDTAQAEVNGDQTLGSTVPPLNPEQMISSNPVSPDENTIASIPMPEIVLPDPPGLEQPDVTPSPVAKPPGIQILPVKHPLSIAELDGLALFRGAKQTQWKVLVNEEARSQDHIAVPYPFRAKFTLGPDYEIQLKPGTRMQRLADTAESVPHLLLERGRVVITRVADSNADDTTIIINISGTNWLLNFTEPGTRFGIEAIPPTPYGLPGQLHGLVYELHVGVFSGAMTIGLIDKDQQPLQPTNLWTKWSSVNKKFEMIAEAFPDWVTPEGEFITGPARNLARMYEKEFLLDAPVVQSIGPVVRDRVASNSQFAVKTMALIGRYTELVPALAAEHEETRIAAIEGLREWMVRSPENGDLLIDEVTRNYPDDEIETIVRLLWGYSENELKDAAISRELIEYLKSEHIEIRELAFFYVSRLGSTTKGYRPLLPAHERKAAILRLESYLEQFGALKGS